MVFVMPSKDPDEVLDYVLDWTDRLAGDTILTSDAILEDGDCVIDSQGFSGVEHTVWLSSGTAGKTCEVTMRVVTAAGRTMDERIRVKVKDR